jgi:uncharacterized membrane protein HdeD (DUF308 family)
MTTQDAPEQGYAAEHPMWLRLLLGLVLILAGMFVLGDVVFASIVSAMFIGVAAIVAGAFEIIHAFWTKGWGGFLWQILLGVLYICAGFVLLSQPVAGALILTWVIGIVMLASGMVRLVVGIDRWSSMGWLLLLSGVFGIVAGLIILRGWPQSGLWFLGLLLGIDLIFHGVGWLATARGRA